MFEGFGPLGFSTNNGGGGGSGPQGDQGPQGFTGNGFQGARGFQGNNGNNGSSGQQGYQGPQGLKGPQGLDSGGISNPILDNSSLKSIDFYDRMLFDSSLFQSLDWQNHFLYDSAGNLVIDFSNTGPANGGMYYIDDSILQGNGSGLTDISHLSNPISDSSLLGSINFDNRQLLYEDGSTISIDWNNSILYDSQISLNWTSRILYDIAGIASIDYNNRHLVNASGNVKYNYDTDIFYDNSSISCLIPTLRLLDAGYGNYPLDWSGRNDYSACYYFDSNNNYNLTGSGAGLGTVCDVSDGTYSSITSITVTNGRISAIS